MNNQPDQPQNNTPLVPAGSSWQDGLNTFGGDHITPNQAPPITQPEQMIAAQQVAPQANPNIPTQAQMAPPIPPQAQPMALPPENTSSKKKMIIIGGALGILFIIIGIVIFFTNGSDSPSETPQNNASSEQAMALSAPSNIIATPQSETASITVSWNSAIGADSYILEYSTDPSFESTTYTKADLTESSTEITGIRNDATYYIRVASVKDSQTSSWSQTVSIEPSTDPAPAPSIPTQATLAVPSKPTITNRARSTLTVAWNKVEGAERYQLEFSRSSNFSGKVYVEQPSGTSVQLTGLAASMTYHIRVAAVKGPTTTGWSEVTSGTTLAASSGGSSPAPTQPAPAPAPTPTPTPTPAKPKNVTLTPGPVLSDGSTHINARWTAANASARAEILWTGGATAGVPRAPKGDGGGGATSDRANGLRENTRYCFKVREYSGSTAGAWSEETCVTTNRR